jgi:hypothetical protein
VVNSVQAVDEAALGRLRHAIAAEDGDEEEQLNGVLRMLGAAIPDENQIRLFGKAPAGQAPKLWSAFTSPARPASFPRSSDESVQKSTEAEATPYFAAGSDIDGRSGIANEPKDDTGPLFAIVAL